MVFARVLREAMRGRVAYAGVFLWTDGVASSAADFAIAKNPVGRACWWDLLARPEAWLGGRFAPARPVG